MVVISSSDQPIGAFKTETYFKLDNIGLFSKPQRLGSPLHSPKNQSSYTMTGIGSVTLCQNRWIADPQCLDFDLYQTRQLMWEQTW